MPSLSSQYVLVAEQDAGHRRGRCVRECRELIYLQIISSKGYEWNEAPHGERALQLSDTRTRIRQRWFGIHTCRCKLSMSTKREFEESDTKGLAGESLRNPENSSIVFLVGSSCPAAAAEEEMKRSNTRRTGAITEGPLASFPRTPAGEEEPRSWRRTGRPAALRVAQHTDEESAHHL